MYIPLTARARPFCDAAMLEVQGDDNQRRYCMRRPNAITINFRKKVNMKLSDKIKQTLASEAQGKRLEERQTTLA